MNIALKIEMDTFIGITFGEAVILDEETKCI